MPSITVGRSLLTLSCIASTAGPFAADWSETHVLNPKWPPHARFHNGQTMSMGAALGVSTLYYTWRSYPTLACGRQGVVTAMLLGSLYWATGLSAVLYPGSLYVVHIFFERLSGLVGDEGTGGSILSL